MNSGNLRTGTMKVWCFVQRFVVQQCSTLNSGTLNCGTLYKGTLYSSTLNRGTLYSSTLNNGILNSGNLNCSGTSSYKMYFSFCWQLLALAALTLWEVL